VWLDLDSDGDSDVIVGSLSGADRVYLNDGAGNLAREDGACVDGPDTPGTLGLAAGDIDDDGKPDLVMAQGEQAFDDRVYLGDDVAEDTAAPRVGALLVPATDDGDDDDDDAPSVVIVRAHDGKSPLEVFDLSTVTLTTDKGDAPMEWFGESLWRARIPAGARELTACATDRAGNDACGPTLTLPKPAGGAGAGADDAPTCAHTSAARGSTALGATALLALASISIGRTKRRRT
jgi:hypothetical protein